MGIKRRQFVGAVAATIVPRHVLGGPGFVAPSDKVNIALIGAGGQGRTNARALFAQPDAQIIAVCDPNEQSDYSRWYFKGVAGRKPVKAEIEKHYAPRTPNFRCTEYEDYRLLLEKEKAVDALLIATPDHVHALISIAAMRAGKHVYCEKPLTHNVWEARTVARVAQESGVATQMGNQGHSTEGIRATCEWLWDGAIGTVRAVHAWCDANRWIAHVGRPKEAAPIPPGFNWDLWLGPRAPRPYHPSYAPVAWRDYWDFGTGAIGDFFCHDVDAACWALDLAAPLAVEGCAPQLNPDTTPVGGLYRYHFGPRGKLPPITLTWYDGGLRPERPEGLPERERMPGRGALFVGEHGVLLCPGAGGAPRLLPDEKMHAYRRPTPTLTRSKGHHRDWLAACKGGPPASSHFGYGARLTELALLGIVALRTGKRIHWDAATMKATNAPEADRFLKEEYRKGWEIAG